MIGEIIARLGDIVYSTVGESLPETCARMLKDDGQTLASCGELHRRHGRKRARRNPRLLHAFLLEGCVTYSDAAKVSRLGVKQETLDQFGAVSEQCAREMAEGMRKTSGADYALATTGYAGPDGGTEENPSARSISPSRGRVKRWSSASPFLWRPRAHPRDRDTTRLRHAPAKTLPRIIAKKARKRGKKRCTRVARAIMNCKNVIICSYRFA